MGEQIPSFTFRLELELGQWIDHLDDLGFSKEPVERKELKRPFDFAQAMEKSETQLMKLEKESASDTTAIDVSNEPKIA